MHFGLSEVHYQRPGTADVDARHRQCASATSAASAAITATASAASAAISAVSADGRFAPSPTGPLHLGNLRTALLAWLMARSRGARFLVRIEDLDPQRSRPEHERSQLADLRALGIDWDGEPVRQSERVALYDHALAQLDAQGLLYPCFCTRAQVREAEIREAASAPTGALARGAYPGTCRRIDPVTRRQRIEAGEPFALRIDAASRRIDWHDRLLGDQHGEVDDFVVVRADGVHAYQLAVVVDDAEQRIGEVVRGADLAESTPRQILLQQLLGLPPLSYAHVPLVISPEGTRLAKRDRAVTLADRDEPPAATLALLAHSIGLAGGRGRVQSPADLLSEFDPERIPSEPLVLGAGAGAGTL
jgi:glutamyl-tRNA synthetase